MVAAAPRRRPRDGVVLDCMGFAHRVRSAVACCPCSRGTSRRRRRARRRWACRSRMPRRRAWTTASASTRWAQLATRRLLLTDSCRATGDGKDAEHCLLIRACHNRPGAAVAEAEAVSTCHCEHVSMAQQAQHTLPAGHASPLTTAAPSALTAHAVSHIEVWIGGLLTLVKHLRAMFFPVEERGQGLRD
jgi:hypothetical protein